MISKTDMSIEEVVETLTGFEEQDIEKGFGAQIGELLELKPTMGMRALAIVMVKRDLVKQDVKSPAIKAHTHVMDMSLKQVNEFFPDDEPEETPKLGQPVTPAGEGVPSADG